VVVVVVDVSDVTATVGLVFGTTRIGLVGQAQECTLHGGFQRVTKESVLGLGLGWRKWLAGIQRLS